MIGEMSLKRCSLAELFSLIEKDSHLGALNELITNRNVFYFSGGRFSLIEYLRNLNDQFTFRDKLNIVIADCAFDKTLQKFSALTIIKNCLTDREEISSNSETKRKSIDCRNYYRALLIIIDDWKKKNADKGYLEEAYKSAEIFQKFVIKHYYLSIKECRREQMPFTRRYFWKVKGKTIILKCPVEVPGMKFRNWLEQNIDNPDPDRPGEADRIQAEVNKRFLRIRHVAWDDKRLQEVTGEKSLSKNMSFSIEEETPFSQTLGMAVASEKMANFSKMRPAIKRLGKEVLRSLVLRIFRDIDDGIFEDNRIAKDFGLSKATFSRFAGSQWSEKLGKKGIAVPDLWVNTARVLASNRDFLETAMTAGVLPKLERVLEITGDKDG